MNFNFMSNRYVFYSISVLLIVASVLCLCIRGFNYGIDFKGGNIVHVTFNEPANESKIKAAITEIGKTTPLYFTADNIVVQAVSGSQEREFIIQYPAAVRDTAESAKVHDVIISELRKQMPFSDDLLETSNVGPTVGDEMKKGGILAAILSCIMILIYLAWRFDFASASGVVLAVVHDLIITLGFICASGMEFDTTVLAAVLTLLGYSVNDSIVIFDRIRENKRIAKVGTSYAKLVDDSINQSLSRTMNTTITTLLALIALVLYGGDSIHSFAVALTFGSIIGTYSSNCLAATMVADIFNANNQKTLADAEAK